MNITLSLTGGGIVNNASKNPSDVNISACLPVGQTGQASNGDKIVSINTSSKKMQEYLKHHPISECCSDNNSQSSSHLENRKKKTPQRITDVDALFEGNII